MWIKRADYDRMLGNALTVQGANGALESQLATQKTTIDWLLVRLTQLEHERAQLIYRYMDVKIVTPEFSPDKNPVGAQAISDIPSFEDVGDEKAKELGLDWDSEGRVTAHGRAIS
jgi:hypothetical protein